MRLTANGDILAGAGGVQGSFNQIPYPFQTYGGGAPLSATQVLVSIPAPSPDLAHLATWTPGAASPTPLAIGPNDLAADGGRWIAWRAGMGVYGSLGPLPSAGVPSTHAVAPDGTIAYVPDRSIGLGLILVDPDNTTYSLPGILPSNTQVIGAGQVIWAGGAFGRPVPKPALTDAQNLLLCPMPDGDWLVYWSNSTGFIAQLDGALDGYILGNTPTFFNPDVRNVNGTLKIAWSVTQGESPADVRSTIIDRTQPRVPLTSTVTIPTFHFTHPVIVAPFKDPNADTVAPWEVVVNQFPQSSTRPAIVAGDSLLARKGPIEGIYSEAADPTQDIALAVKSNTRLVLGHDNVSAWTLPTTLRIYDIPALELYLQTSETITQSVVRWQSQIQLLLTHWSGSIGVIPMFYCAGGAPPAETFTVAQVCDGLSHLSDIVNLSPRIQLILPFEYLRANGIAAHWELQQAFRNLMSEQARVGLAQLPPIQQSQGDLMQMSSFDTNKGLIAYQSIKPSGQAGCVNLILPDGSVFSCQGDGSAGTRPSGTDGPWEQGQVSGSVVTYHVDGVYHSFGMVPVNALP